MASLTGRQTDPGTAAPPGPVVLRAAAALAAAMGIGRFVYTPILPLMQQQAGLAASAGALVATANYAGYLVGSVVGIVAPAVVGSRLVLRAGLVGLVATLAAMPLVSGVPAWFALRFGAGVASALVFVIAASAMLARPGPRAQRLVGWGFGGVGAGIALSGLVVLLLAATPLASWRAAWWAAAALALLIGAAAWSLAPATPAAPAPDAGSGPRRTGPFAALLVSYSLEGVGYIIAGTFLVAAIGEAAAAGTGTAAWVLVGLAAVPASAAWAVLARRRGGPVALLAALGLQAVGIAVPAVSGSAAAALVSAVLFGATFLAVASLALAIGAQLGVPRAVALLTTGYSVGQMLGPLVVAPLVEHGYRGALLVGAGVVVAAALAAGDLMRRASAGTARPR
jgi:predicted MFS family arabinose efflux permease